MMIGMKRLKMILEDERLDLHLLNTETFRNYHCAETNHLMKLVTGNDRYGAGEEKKIYEATERQARTIRHKNQRKIQRHQLWDLKMRQRCEPFWDMKMYMKTKIPKKHRGMKVEVVGVDIRQTLEDYLLETKMDNSRQWINP